MYLSLGKLNLGAALLNMFIYSTDPLYSTSMRWLHFIDLKNSKHYKLLFLMIDVFWSLTNLIYWKKKKI